jgi:hypothetical protein
MPTSLSWLQIEQGFRSLFLAYLIPQGMEVLRSYGSSLGGPDDFQRLFHTAFWAHMCMELEDSALSTNSLAFQGVLHVRLMHSAEARYSEA